MKRLVVLLAAMIALTVRPVDAGQVVGVADLSGLDISRKMFGIAVVNLDVTVEGVSVTAARASIDVYLTGLPPGTTIFGAVVTEGNQDVNGPVKIDSGIDPLVVTGTSITFNRRDLFVSPADAAAIMGTLVGGIVQPLGGPDGFYVTLFGIAPGCANPVHCNLPMRGKLRSVDPFQFALPFPGLVAALYTNQSTFVPGDRFQVRVAAGNFDVPRQADIFAGVTLTPTESANLCSAPNDRALQFRNATGATSVECQSNLIKPGNHAIPFVTNVTLPVQGLQVAMIVDEPMRLVPGTHTAFVCAATPGTVPTGSTSGGVARCATANFTVLVP